MDGYIPKWHRELGIFTRIKLLIIIEGNVLDVYQFPAEGSIAKGSILKLPEYLHYYFTDMGYQTIVHYDSTTGFYNSCKDGHIESFAELTEAKFDGKFIRAEFSDKSPTATSIGKTNTAASIVRKAMGQNKNVTAVIMSLISRYITSPDSMAQGEVDSFTKLLLTSLEGNDVRTGKELL
jgi:hypothetical protein